MRNPEQDSTAKTRRMPGYPASTESMMERMLERWNVTRAWRQVKQNHGAPGCDGMTVEEFPTYARARWEGVRTSLNEGMYRPSPVRRVEIPKPSGGTRALGIPTVTDRVIQQAIAQILTPIFDPEFSESSFGFRPGRSAHQAVRKVREHIDAGYTVAVEVDLKKFFDEVNHDVLMERVSGSSGTNPCCDSLACIFVPASWLTRLFSRRLKVCRRVGPCHRCLQTSSWTTSTKSWRNAGTGLRAMPMTSSFWSKARGPVNASKYPSRGFLRRS